MGRRMRNGLWIALAAVAAASPGVRAYADESGVEDPRFGFKMHAPGGWKRVPTQVDEKWIAAKFLSDREYADRKEGWTSKPEMDVVVFTEEARKRRGAQVEKKGDTTIYWIESPYKDYRDYLKRTHTEGGWYFSKEEKGVIDGVDVEFLEAKVEKLSYGGNKRILAWIYHREDADFAITVEVLEDWYEKLKGPIESSFKSFKFIARTAAAPSQVTTGETLIDKIDESKLTPEERKQRRTQKQGRFLEKAIAGLPKGWNVYRYPNLVVLAHVDKRIADFMADQAIAVLDWCEAKFGTISDEFVRTPIIRICKDSEEESAFRTGGGGSSFWGSGDQEFVTNGGYDIPWEIKWVNGRIASFWFSEKDNDFAYAMPHWLRDGLEEYLSSVTAKGKKLVFTDISSRVDVVKAAKDGTLASPKDLMVKELDYANMATRSDFDAMRSDRAQDAFLVRYLIDGPGKGGRTKDLVLHYIEAFRQVSGAAKKDKENDGKASPDAPSADSEPKTEEEEEEQMRKRRAERHTYLDDGRKKISQDTFDKVFAGWTEKDWRSFEGGFKASVSK